MYPIKSSDTLSKVTRFELSRDFQNLIIEVHHLLAGGLTGQFHAYLRSGGELIASECWGSGNSEGAALRDCLVRIQDLSFDQVVTHP